MAVSAGLLLPAFARGAPDPDPAAILRVADASRHVLEEGVLRVRATVRRTGRPTSEHDLDVYVQGRDRVLCVFRSGDLLGRRILTAGARVWLLVPDTAHPIPISANQRLLGGASIGDVARLRFSDDFDAALRPDTEQVDGTTCRVLDLAARSARAPYRSGILWAGEDDDLPRKVRLALPGGRAAKEISFSAYERAGGRAVLRTMTIRHLLRSERDTTTTLELLRHEARRLEPWIFDPLRARELP